MNPIQDKVSSIESSIENSPFTKALPMIVNVPTDPKGHAEIYIDEFMVAVVDIDDNTTRANKTVHLEIHTIGRLLLSHNPTARKDFISSKKLTAEAGQSETKRNLGWNINTRNISIALPKDKVTA